MALELFKEAMKILGKGVSLRKTDFRAVKCPMRTWEDGRDADSGNPD